MQTLCGRLPASATFDGYKWYFRRRTNNHREEFEKAACILAMGTAGAIHYEAEGKS